MIKLSEKCWEKKPWKIGFGQNFKFELLIFRNLLKPTQILTCHHQVYLYTKNGDFGKKKVDYGQGTNARKVFSKVCDFLYCSVLVFGRKSKHKTDVTAWHGIHFHKNNLWNILLIGNYIVNLQNHQN